MLIDDSIPEKLSYSDVKSKFYTTETRLWSKSTLGNRSLQSVLNRIKTISSDSANTSVERSLERSSIQQPQLDQTISDFFEHRGSITPMLSVISPLLTSSSLLTHRRKEDSQHNFKNAKTKTNTGLKTFKELNQLKIKREIINLSTYKESDMKKCSKVLNFLMFKNCDKFYSEKHKDFQIASGLNKGSTVF